MVHKSGFHSFAVITLVLVLAACNLPEPEPASPIADEDMMALSVAMTMTALYTPPPPATDTPAFTETATLTPSPVFSPTSSVPMVIVSVDTNCRTGPGQVYDRSGGLQVGETAEVVGRNSGGDYWYIRNPDVPSSFCWLWGYYATVTGNTSGLPVMTPPPTPTPPVTFTVSYLSMVSCAGTYAFRFQLTNTGSLTWESYSVSVVDTTATQTRSHTNDFFVEYVGCGPSVASHSDLTPGETAVAGNWGPGGLFNYNLVGHNITATFTLCAQNALGGQCVNKTISFTP